MRIHDERDVNVRLKAVKVGGLSLIRGGMLFTAMSEEPLGKVLRKIK